MKTFCDDKIQRTDKNRKHNHQQDHEPGGRQHLRTGQPRHFFKFFRGVPKKLNQLSNLIQESAPLKLKLPNTDRFIQGEGVDKLRKGLPIIVNKKNFVNPKNGPRYGRESFFRTSFTKFFKPRTMALAQSH